MTADGDRRRGGPDRRARSGTGPTREGARGSRPEASPPRPSARPPRPGARPPRRPPLPEERPRLPREAYRDLRATVPAGALDDVVKAVGVARAAVDEGDLQRATVYLEWAKRAASRSATVREALGVVRYLAGDYRAAASELRAYRRLSGRQDQNHLLADCARAAGRPDQVSSYVEEMIAADVDVERVAEGLIVLASDRADRGDLRAALHALQRAHLDPVTVRSWHARLWFVAADLHARLGDVVRARDYLEAVLAVDPNFPEAAERLAALG